MSFLLLQLIKNEMAIRENRLKVFGHLVAGEPWWDILLDVAHAHFERRRLQTTGIASYVGVPQTTTLRYLDIMSKAGLIQRLSDPRDKRRVWVEITNLGIQKLEDTFLKVPKSKMRALIALPAMDDALSAHIRPEAARRRNGIADHLSAVATEISLKLNSVSTMPFVIVPADVFDSALDGLRRAERNAIQQ